MAGQTASGVYSNKVFAADLNASVSGVFDLYRKDGNASSGVPTVQAEVADGSVTASKLSSEVSNALKPVVVEQPSSVVEVGGNPAYLAVDATGVNNSYQWKKNGVDIAGATNHTLSIADLNASQHEGNYTLVVSNAFGSATSSVAQIDVNGSLTEGLVGWWKFDETDGDVAYDSSGNGNEGNLTNGPTWVEGKIGGALSFDGVNDYVNFGVRDVFNLESKITVSLWIKAFDYKYAQVISKSTLSGVFTWAFKWRVSSERFYFRIYDPSGQFETFLRYNQNPPLNEWSNILFSYGDSNSNLYLNSNLEAEGNFTATFTNQTNPLLLGGAGSEMFFGLIDDLRIYDRALSAFEVKALYELGSNRCRRVDRARLRWSMARWRMESIRHHRNCDATILKYLKPEITQQPTATYHFCRYKWYHLRIRGRKVPHLSMEKEWSESNRRNQRHLSITDANATQHDGNYSVVVSNDFGSVESGDMEVVISFWTPSVITALKLWLDANDTSSIFLGSGKVSAWNDKSGNSKNATQSTGSARPTFLTNSVSFDGVDDKLEFPALGLSGDASVVFAFNVLSDDGYSVLTGSGSDHWDRFNVDQRSYPGHFRSLRIETLSLNFPTSGEQILAYLADSAGPKFEIRLNGSNVFQSTDSFSFADNIGILGGNGATAFKGTIMEVVVIDDYSTEVVQRLEGYLAGKWGLLNNLPNDHPYK